MARNCFIRLIKDIDIFGHPVRFNFDQKGPTHRTCCGGVATIIFFITVLGSIALLVLG